MRVIRSGTACQAHFPARRLERKADSGGFELTQRNGRIVSGRFELAIDKVARIVRDVKDIDIDDLYDQLDKLRDNVHQLSQRVGKSASRQYRHTRDYASEAAQEAEELMKDNLAASLVLALGLGLVVGYLIRRSID